ncbi:MAG: hypothetical protein OQK95_03200 [Gammaproteobacteria bacterium]|nr:hypothetical protein [Gammaproteobacteria bacterium]
MAGLGPIGLGIGVGITVAEALLPGYTSVVDIPDLPAANDDQMCENTSSEDDDDCKQLLKDMVLLFKYVASQVKQNGRANSLMLINSYNKQAASACKVCPGICAAIPRFD